MGSLGQLTYRYRGKIDLNQFFHRGKEFWLNIVDADDFVDGKHKAKADEVEGKWTITHTVDQYHRFIYTVDFKAQDLKDPTAVADGKIRVYVSCKLEEGYEKMTPAGKQEIFKKTKDDKPGLLEKIYKRLTTRQREEDLEGVGIITMHRFVDLCKEVFGSETRYG